MYPVFRSCEVLPAFAAQMQMIAPTDKATGAYAESFQPSATKITHVMMSVAIVIPEIGFDDEPMRPVMRDDTVAKKKPNRMISTETRMLPCVGSPGITARNTARSSDPIKTMFIGRSR